jgi:hypothetical protein
MKEKAEKQFAKVYDELLALGVPLRTATLYGKLEFMAGKKGQCWPTQGTLAKMLRLKTRQQVHNLVEQLRALRLLEVERSRHFCRYRVLPPDVKWILHLTSNGFDISDVKRILHRKESSSRKKRTKEKNSGSGESFDVSARANPNPRATKASADDDEFLRRLRQRHGEDFDAQACLASVKRQLEKRGLSLSDFLPFDSLHTTGANFSNPHGYYVDLAKKLAKQTILEVQNAAFRLPTTAPDCPRDAHHNCLQCGGSGRLPDGSCCDVCPIGLDFAKQARRKAIASRPAS